MRGTSSVIKQTTPVRDSKHGFKRDPLDLLLLLRGCFRSIKSDLMLSRAFASQSVTGVQMQTSALPSHIQVLQTSKSTASRSKPFADNDSPCGSFGEEAVFEVSYSSSPSKGSAVDHPLGGMSTDTKSKSKDSGEEVCVFEAELEDSSSVEPSSSTLSTTAQTALRARGDIRHHFPSLAE